MNIQRLIILGILKESPRHGYEIKKIIKNDIGVFASIESKSIYYPLQIMEKKGFIKKTVAKEKGRPQKYVYSLTPRGDKEFLRLAMEALISEKRPFIDIDIPLYFLPYLNKKSVLARLRLRKRFLEEVRKWLSKNIKRKNKFSPYQRLLLKHHLNLLTAEDGFLDDILVRLK